jgi:hypothetical protein
VCAFQCTHLCAYRRAREKKGSGTSIPTSPSPSPAPKPPTHLLVILDIDPAVLLAPRLIELVIGDVFDLGQPLPQHALSRRVPQVEEDNADVHVPPQLIGWVGEKSCERPTGADGRAWSPLSSTTML